MSLPWWVLVVDDDAEVNALIVEMLCRAAMALLDGASPPGLIIADMTMPDINGVDLVGRAERQGIKCMLITAADPRRLAPRPSAPVMRKPFEVDELIQFVARYHPTASAAGGPQVSYNA
jgi:DNA-binding NtrC family response regulator